MKVKYLISLIVLFAIITTEGKRLSKSRTSSSGRGSSKKTNYNPQPTSLSYPQPSAPKPSLFGWQEKPAQRTQSTSRKSQPPNKQTHSYPSSQTGLSGNSPAKPAQQEGIQRSHVPQNSAGQQYPSHSAAQPQSNSQNQHAYPSSNGLSGSGAGYPQGSGLSGSGAAAPPPYSAGNYPAHNLGNNNNYHSQGHPPPYSSSGVGYPKQQGSGSSGPGGVAPPPYSAGSYPSNNFGNNYHHPQGPPPPYSNNYGGNYGQHNPMFSPQSPGYFGNYGNKGFGGVSRTGSALTGVGIAGAGIGTILTGLALWNLARSTGNRHHTVIYDNRGQPVAVAPNNSTEPVADSILGDLVNCTLTISNGNTTEILAIPCAIATSFTPEANVKDGGITSDTNADTKCTITVVTKDSREFMTTIPCSILLNTAAENNVTEPPLLNTDADIANGTIITSNDSSNSNQPSALKYSGVELNNTNINCNPEPGDIRDPINPCYAITQNITVIPLPANDNSSSILVTTPSSA